MSNETRVPRGPGRRNELNVIPEGVDLSPAATLSPARPGVPRCVIGLAVYERFKSQLNVRGVSSWFVGEGIHWRSRGRR